MSPTCIECGGKVVEASGFLVCSRCGLVISQLFAGDRIYRLNGKKRGFRRFSGSALYGNAFVKTLMACASELKLPSECVRSALRILNKLSRLRNKISLSWGEAVAISIWIAAKWTGYYTPLIKVVSVLRRQRVSVAYYKVIRKLAVLRTLNALPYQAPHEAVTACCAVLRNRGIAVDKRVERKAVSLLRMLRPYIGGRDPQLLALAAIYLASNGTISCYCLAKHFRRAPSRVWSNYRRLQSLLASQRFARKVPVQVTMH